MQPKTSRKRGFENQFHHPISFQFSNFEPTVKGPMGPAKMELKGLYPKVSTVCFLNSRAKEERNGKLKGWLNFANLKDCRETYEEILKNPKSGIVVEKLGVEQAAPLFSSLQVEKPKIMRKKKETNFEKDLKFDKCIKPL